MTDAFNSMETASAGLGVSAELMAAGYRNLGAKECPRGCGRSVSILESPSGRQVYMANGKLHLNCREEEEKIDPLPPIPDQYAKIKAMQDGTKT